MAPYWFPAPTNSILFPINDTRGAGESQHLCHEEEVLCSLNSCHFSPAALCSSQWPRWMTRRFVLTSYQPWPKPTEPIGNQSSASQFERHARPPRGPSRGQSVKSGPGSSRCFPISRHPLQAFRAEVPYRSCWRSVSSDGDSRRISASSLIKSAAHR